RRSPSAAARHTARPLAPAPSSATLQTSRRQVRDRYLRLALLEHLAQPLDHLLLREGPAVVLQHLVGQLQAGVLADQSPELAGVVVLHQDGLLARERRLYLVRREGTQQTHLEVAAAGATAG